MLLAIDIGNTNIVLGVFDGEKLKATWRLSTDVHKLEDEYSVVLLNLLEMKKLAFADIDHAVIASSVPPLVTIFSELCRRYFNVEPLVIGPGTKTGVRIELDNPREAGADRIVNAAAAHSLYEGPLVVIDFGTATTLDAVSREGDYLGGAIAPGIAISAEALFEYAAKLPRVELVRPQKAIGRSTIAAMQSGIIFGYVGLIEGIVDRMKKELGGSVKVIATGGLADVIARETDAVDALEPDLTLIGLRIIYELNNGR
ncbi:MAG: type III pantothenate kinase [Dehalococcoidia bacterium]|nr:MAG: type III pantothenate kinase [Dehalococcoidia bacterium]